MPLAQSDREQSNIAAGRNSNGPRRGGFGGDGSGNTSGRGIRGGGGAGTSTTVPYGEDIHDEPDTIDIVSAMPSGSRSGTGYHSEH